MAADHRRPLTLLLAVTCALQAAAVTGKDLPAWTGLIDSGVLYLCLRFTPTIVQLDVKSKE